MIKKLAAGLLLSAVVSASHATTVLGPFSPGSIGALDNAYAVLVNAHSADNSLFVDDYLFTAAGAEAFLSYVFLPSQLNNVPAADAATIEGIFLLDQSNNLIGADTVGPAAGGQPFAINTLLPGAGLYDFRVLGVGGSGAGLYEALIAIPTGIPEPGTTAMVGLGLGLLALRRFRPAAQGRG